MRPCMGDTMLGTKMPWLATQSGFPDTRVAERQPLVHAHHLRKCIIILRNIPSSWRLQLGELHIPPPPPVVRHSHAYHVARSMSSVMLNDQCVIAALRRTRLVTFSIPGEAVLLEVHSPNVDVPCKTSAKAHQPGKMLCMCHLGLTMALSKKCPAFSRPLTKVTPHGPPPRLRQHQLTRYLPASRDCWTKTGTLRAIITSACITNISTTCTPVSYLADIWTRCSKLFRTTRASSYFY